MSIRSKNNNKINHLLIVDVVAHGATPVDGVIEEGVLAEVAEGVEEGEEEHELGSRSGGIDDTMAERRAKGNS